MSSLALRTSSFVKPLSQFLEHLIWFSVFYLLICGKFFYKFWIGAHSSGCWKCLLPLYALSFHSLKWCLLVKRSSYDFNIWTISVFSFMNSAFSLVSVFSYPQGYKDCLCYRLLETLLFCLSYLDLQCNWDLFLYMVWGRGIGKLNTVMMANLFKVICRLNVIPIQTQQEFVVVVWGTW